MALIGFSSSAVGLLISAAVFGVATGMNSPTIFAWTIDLSHPEHRGRAMATMYIALEAGIGIGALASGWIYANDPSRFPMVFWTGSACAIVAFLYLMLFVKNKK
jgi:MFS family permease